MEKYTNYCTEEQTKRAYKLGTQLTTVDDEVYFIEERNKYPKHINIENHTYYIPTTQQLIGWLRDEDLYIEIGVEWAPTKHFCAYLDKHNLDDTIIGTFHTYEQAELAAIDAALDYLEKGETK